MRTEAYLSPDRMYRYWLLRVWDDSLPINCICGVNPSKADERENDPTIRKDIGFSERQGFGGLLKVNISAFRSTKLRESNPIRVPRCCVLRLQPRWNTTAHAHVAIQH